MALTWGQGQAMYIKYILGHLKPQTLAANLMKYDDEVRMIYINVYVRVMNSRQFNSSARFWYLLHVLN